MITATTAVVAISFIGSLTVCLPEEVGDYLN